MAVFLVVLVLIYLLPWLFIHQTLQRGLLNNQLSFFNFLSTCNFHPSQVTFHLVSKPFIPPGPLEFSEEWGPRSTTRPKCMEVLLPNTVNVPETNSMEIDWQGVSDVQKCISSLPTTPLVGSHQYFIVVPKLITVVLDYIGPMILQSRQIHPLDFDYSSSFTA